LEQAQGSWKIFIRNDGSLYLFDLTHDLVRNAGNS
jgi:hypothetical protein